MIVDKDLFLTWFLVIISDRHGRKQREESSERLERQNQGICMRISGGKARKREREREI